MLSLIFKMKILLTNFLIQKRSDKGDLVSNDFILLVILLTMITHLCLGKIILSSNNDNKMVDNKLFSLILLTKNKFTCTNILLVDLSNTSNIVLHVNLDHKYYDTRPLPKPPLCTF